MELTHAFTVPATVDQTWATFMDLDLVGGCFPGATVTEFTDDTFSGTVKVKLGPIALVYSGSGSFVEKDDATHRAVIEAKGKDKRGNGTAGATVTIQLHAEGADSTRAEVQTDLAVTGKPAQFGRGVMQDVSDKLLGQFIACIEGKLGPAAAEPAQAPEGAPAATEVAPVPGTGVDGAGTEPAAGDPATEVDPVGSAPSAPTPPAPSAAAPSTPTLSTPTATPRPAAPAAAGAGGRAQAKEENALSAFALLGVVLKSIWRRLLVALRLRKPDA